MKRHLPPVLCLFLFCFVSLEIFSSGSTRETAEARMVFAALLAVLTPFAAWPLFPTHEGANKALLPSCAVCFIAVLIYMATQANFVLMIAALAVGIGATAFACINGLTPNSRDRAPEREYGTPSARQGGYGGASGHRAATAAAVGVGAMAGAGVASAMAQRDRIEPSNWEDMFTTTGGVNLSALEMATPMVNVDGTPMLGDSGVDVHGRAYGDTTDMTGFDNGGWDNCSGIDHNTFGHDFGFHESFSHGSFGSSSFSSGIGGMD